MTYSSTTTLREQIAQLNAQIAETTNVLDRLDLVQARINLCNELSLHELDATLDHSPNSPAER